MHVVATNHFNVEEKIIGCKHGFESIETLQHEINELLKVEESGSKVDELMEQKLGHLVGFSMKGSFIY